MLCLKFLRSGFIEPNIELMSYIAHSQDFPDHRSLACSEIFRMGRGCKSTKHVRQSRNNSFVFMDDLHFPLKHRFFDCERDDNRQKGSCSLLEIFILHFLSAAAQLQVQWRPVPYAPYRRQRPNQEKYPYKTFNIDLLYWDFCSLYWGCDCPYSDFDDLGFHRA